MSYKYQFGNDIVFSAILSGTNDKPYFKFQKILELSKVFKPDDIFTVMEATLSLCNEDELSEFDDSDYRNSSELLIMLLNEFKTQKLLKTSQNGIAYIINSFVFSMCSLTIGFLIGSITQNKSAIGGIINVVALGTSFLCGCFVPFEYMPSYVTKIYKILPTYYYVRNNEMISSIEIFNLDNIIPLLVNIIIIIIFGIIFILITNRLDKKNRIIN